MKQSELNEFKRKYLDSTKCINQGTIVHDPGTTTAHRRLVIEITEWAHARNMVFFTRAFLKEGKIVDVVIPELPRPFIEVRHTELKKTKEYLSQYEKDIIFVDTDDPFRLT